MAARKKDVMSLICMIGLLFYWFMDRLSEYLANYNPINEESTRSLIDTFHDKYVVGFGKR
jgi:hypothetical protein